MKKSGGSESTIIIGPSTSVLVYALHGLEYVLVFDVRAKLIIIIKMQIFQKGFYCLSKYSKA